MVQIPSRVVDRREGRPRAERSGQSQQNMPELARLLAGAYERLQVCNTQPHPKLLSGAEKRRSSETTSDPPSACFSSSAERP